MSDERASHSNRRGLEGNERASWGGPSAPDAVFVGGRLRPVTRSQGALGAALPPLRSPFEAPLNTLQTDAVPSASPYPPILAVLIRI